MAVGRCGTHCGDRSGPGVSAVREHEQRISLVGFEIVFAPVPDREVDVMNDICFLRFKQIGSTAPPNPVEGLSP